MEAQPRRTLWDRVTSTAGRQTREGLAQAAARFLIKPDDQTHTDPATGQSFTYRSLGTQLRSDERASRETYGQTVQGDEWYRAPGGLQGRAVAGAATLAGTVAGALSDPTNLLGLGGKTILQRVLGEVAVNAASDAGAQGFDLGSGVQQGGYDPGRTALAGVVGGVIGGGVHGVEAGGRAVADAGRRVFDYGRWAGESLNARVANPVPEFGAGMDTGSVARARPDVAARAAPVARMAPAPATIAPHIARASERSGVSADYLTNLARRESAFNPSAAAGTSTARGLYQFTEDTWLGTLRRHAADLGVSDIDARIRSNPFAVLAMRNDPDLSSRAAAALTQDNAASLRRTLGRNPTDAELYTAHFLGDGNAGRLAMAAPDANAASMFPAAARANRSIFYEGRRARTVAEVQARLAQGFGAGGAPVTSRGVASTYAEPGVSREASPSVASTFNPSRLDNAALGSDGPQVARAVDLPTSRLAEVETPTAVSTPSPGEPLRPVDGERLSAPAADTAFDPGRPFEKLNAPEARAFNPAKPFTPEKLNVDLGGYAGRIGQTMPSGGQTVGGLRDAPRPDAIARGAGADYAGKTVSQLADDLRSALGLTHRQGRVTAKKALGEYDTGSGVIRTKAVQELDVLAHEATHALEFEIKGPTLSAALQTHAKHLETLAYPGAAPGVKREEGFAEFGRWYLSNPDHARRIAPDFYDAFEAAMAKDAPNALAGMQAVQAGYQNLLASASIDVAKGSLAYTGSKGPIGNLVDEVRRSGPGSTLRRVVDDLYTAAIDDLHPVAVAVRKLSEIYAENTGKKLELKRANDPYALARLSREAYAAGHGDLMNGVTPYRTVDAEGASLADALATAGLDTTATGKIKSDALKEFDVYLIARRMVHEWDRYAKGDLPNPPDRNTKAFHEQVIADAEASNPTWGKAADQVYEFLNNLWKKEFDAGLITEASYRHGLDAHESYVPLMRDMSDKGLGKAGKPRGALQFAGGVKAFEGSSRDIISPLSSIMRRAYELNAIIKKNDVMLALDDLAQAAGRGAGSIVERLPAKEIEAFTVNAADALQKTADELELSGRDLSTMQKFADDAQASDAMITLFKQSEFSPRKGESVVFVWRNGQKTPLLLPDGEFGKAMFESLAGMNKQLTNVVVDSMAAATQLLRYGVTLSPEFMGANLVRDALATWINSDVGFVPVVDTIRGGILEVAQGQTAKRYANAGGMRGGANVAATSKPFPKTDAEAEAQLQHLRRKGWKIKRYASWRGLAEFTDLSETSTRMGVFAKGFDKAKKQGLTDYEAIIESGFTSRDYLDFGRRGSKMMTASRVVTFLNAALQGLDKSVRVLSAGGNLQRVLLPLTKEARTPAEKAALGHAYKAWAKVSALGALGLGLRMLYADDPEYQEINTTLRATNWIFRSGGSWIFIPKPFELATISNILERGYEGTVLKDPLAGERLLSDFRHTIAPPSEIPALSVPFHIASNRDYLDRPIVPDHLRGTVDPEMQFTGFTSDLGKLIGRTFKVSPAVVDYVVTGFGGSLGRYVLQGSNIVGEAATGRPRTAAGPEDMFLARRFVRQIARGSVSQGQFWDQVSRDGGRMVRAEGSFRSLMKEGKDAEATAYLNRLDPDERAYVAAKVFSEDGSSRDHPLVRVQNVVSILSDFRTAVRDGSLRDQTATTIRLTPQQRRTIDNAIGDLAQAEMRNALIEAKVKGWEQKQPMDTYAAAARIGRADPAVAGQLQGWLALARAPTVFAPGELAASQARWQATAPAFRGRVDPAQMAPVMQRERQSSGDRLARYREGQRAAGASRSASPAPMGLLAPPAASQGQSASMGLLAPPSGRPAPRGLLAPQ
ncbi:LPD38 domain-containing protein [Brevundimonas sp. TWP3-1-2b1]|uniref:LPD38 domain-containing protein n=1 Tax=Brevundimonas sp. TWP3-1-2b1 TaxID=2804650 RepID=UPI003CEC98D6